MATMMQNCFSLIMTLDNVLYTYTLALLSYLSSDHAVAAGECVHG